MQLGINEEKGYVLTSMKEKVDVLVSNEERRLRFDINEEKR